MLRAGYSPKKGPYSENVRRGIKAVLRAVEASDANTLRIETARGTQIQRKIGENADTFLAAMVLATARGTKPDEASEANLEKALAKIVTKMELNQKEKGDWQGEGWAPVLSQALASRAFNLARQVGMAVDGEKLENTARHGRESFKKLMDGKGAAALDKGGAPHYVAVTMLGNTTRAVMRVKERLAEYGMEAVIFHSNGVGGPAMEELAEAGMFAGVIDYTTDEISDQIIGGFHMGGERRLERVGALGLPQVVVPGCIDFSVNGPRDEVPERLHGRPAYYHNPEFTLVRLLPDEMEQVGHIMARKLNGAKGPVVVVVPTRGLSIPNVPGGVFWNPDADARFLDALRADLRGDIPLITMEANANDPAFGDRVADEYLKLVGQPPKLTG